MRMKSKNGWCNSPEYVVWERLFNTVRTMHLINIFARQKRELKKIIFSK